MNNLTNARSAQQWIGVAAKVTNTQYHTTHMCCTIPGSELHYTCTRWIMRVLPHLRNLKLCKFQHRRYNIFMYMRVYWFMEIVIIRFHENVVLPHIYENLSLQKTQCT